MARSKGLVVFLIVFGIFVFFGLMFIVAISTMLDDTPVVKDQTVVTLNLGGIVTEHFPRDAFSRELEGASIQLHDVVKALKMATVDDRIKGLFLRISAPSMGWAKAQEIRNEILRFKESEKFVITFMEACNELSYYIALTADGIYLQPHSFAELNGFASEVPFLKGTFNKLGMEPQVVNIGKYKNAGDILTRDSMSEAHREATEALLEEVYEEFVATVCETRDLNRTEFERSFNEGLYRSEQALEAGLIDDLKYENDVVELIRSKIHGEGSDKKIRTISARRYAKISPDEVGLGRGEKIALIYALGSIVSGEGGHDPLMGRNMGSGAVVRMLHSVRDNSSVKAVVIRVDSPGGSVLASDVIWAEIERVQEKKPVVISMSDVAASGGYWISMGADAIVAQPLTITGSIGVVGTLFNLSGTYDKLGIKWETVKKGRHADIFTDKRALTREEWAIFKENTYAIYETFVQKVADSRDRTWPEIHEIAQGRVWTGIDAFEHGLVDTLGGIDVALAIAKEKAELDADKPTQWVVYPQRKGFLESLFEKLNVRVAKYIGSKNENLALFKNLTHETRGLLKQVSFMRRFYRGEALAIALDLVEIR